ncbi:MAG: metallophosphoesterase [Desulfobulbaceae bacterium]|jgi:hypothetical protein|nr:metallophosphoesterase [Desulfobulbaceae bacterium]
MSEQAKSQTVKNPRGYLKSGDCVILYPALTSPALVPVGDKGELNIILAGNEDVKSYYDNAEKKEFLRYCHSHLRLPPWRDLYGEPHPKGSVPKGQIFNTGQAHYNDLYDLSGYQNMIYKRDQHDGPIKAYDAGQCDGWFLRELKPGKEEDGTVSIDDGKTPFGILGSSAVAMLLGAPKDENKYKYLFHLRFSGIQNRDEGMYEVIWFACWRDEKNPEKPWHYIPKEDIVLPKFTQEIVQGGEKANNKQKLLQPAKPPEASDESLPPKEKPRCENSYALFDLGVPCVTPEQKSFARNQNQPPEKQPDSSVPPLSCLWQSGHLFTPRHPVYFSDKPLLDIGVIADPHISSRQSLYKTVGARVIPGVDSFDQSQIVSDGKAKIVAPEASDSPLIGLMAHENLQTARELFEKIGAASDVIVFAGDIYDHIRNLNPKAYKNPEGKTSVLWNSLRYRKNYENDRQTYPRFIDAMMALELIYQTYAGGKAVIYLAGNHEGYERPYGISPRVPSATVDMVKANEGIPLDHNLTFYEAVLLYGDAYGDYYMGNYAKENYDWLHTTLSPWKDIFISYGEKQNIVCLDWGRDEKYVDNFVSGGDTLPRASQAIDDKQLKLLQRAPAKGGQNGVVNILCSHFTFAAYTPGKSLFNDAFASNEPVQAKTTTTSATKEGYSVDVGTFGERKSEVWSIACEKFTYIISGHTHRAGIYELSAEKSEAYTPDYGTGQTIQSNKITPMSAMKDLRDAIFIGGGKETLALVSGSCGTYNKRNMFGEFAGHGFDVPQGMVLEPRGKWVKIVLSKAPKPRLAVVMDYLWFDGKELFEPVQGIWAELTASYQFNPNQTLRNLFRYQAADGRFAPSIPVDYMKLHAVTNDGTHRGCLLMKVEDATAKTVQLEVTGADVAKFVQFAESKVPDKNSLYYFLSIHFGGKSCSAKHIADYYDLASPWCMPVTLRKLNPRWGNYAIHRGGGFGNITGELPDFEKLKKIPEYALKPSAQK